MQVKEYDYKRYNRMLKENKQSNPVTEKQQEENLVSVKGMHLQSPTTMKS